MKRIISILLLAAFALEVSAASKPVTLKSPNKRLEVSFSNFEYSIKVDGQTMLSPSKISMTLENGTVYGAPAKVSKVSRRTVNNVIKAPVYKKAEIKDNFNEMTLVYKNFDIIFRAYDEGVAYRFVAKESKHFNVKSEVAEFSFPDNWKSCYSYCNRSEGTLEDQLCCSFENLYERNGIKDWDPTHPVFLPVVVEASNGYKIAITESDLFSFPGLNLCNTDGSTTLKGIHARYPKVVDLGGHNMLQGMVRTREDVIAHIANSHWSFPWRIIQIAREDKELAASDMVYKLAKAPEEGKDFSWVKPGKVAWEWWNNWNITGVDFVAGVNNDTYKHYIDFASENGIEYVILDEGWSVNLKTDLMQVVPEIDIEELCKYAKKKNVGIILWAGYKAVEKDMEDVFLHYSMLGVKGFKIDFMDRDDQQVVDFCTACAEMGAKYRMLVDFHGIYKPAGLNRTYPNAINFEGVHGLENMKWAAQNDIQVIYDCTIPFIRMMAGPMDYTQGAMLNATRENYRPCNGEPMSQGTRCRQLAEYMIFDAPLCMLCDSPSHYRKEPECTAFIAEVPTVWDETIALTGKMGEYIAIARRKGNDWYIGAITDWQARTISIDLGFLPEGTFKAQIFKDGPNASREGKDFLTETAEVKGGKVIKAEMAPGGGWVAKISK